MRALVAQQLKNHEANSWTYSSSSLKDEILQGVLSNYFEANSNTDCRIRVLLKLGSFLLVRPSYSPSLSILNVVTMSVIRRESFKITDEIPHTFAQPELVVTIDGLLASKCCSEHHFTIYKQHKWTMNSLKWIQTVISGTWGNRWLHLINYLIDNSV